MAITKNALHIARRMPVNILWGFLMTIFLSSCTTLMDTTPYDDGSKKIENKEFTKAIQDFDAAIKRNPKDAKAYNNRGVAKVAVGRFQEAIKDFNKSIRLGGENAKMNKRVAERGQMEVNVLRQRIEVAAYSRLALLRNSRVAARVNTYDRRVIATVDKYARLSEQQRNAAALARERNVATSRERNTAVLSSMAPVVIPLVNLGTAIIALITEILDKLEYDEEKGEWVFVREPVAN